MTTLEATDATIVQPGWRGRASGFFGSRAWPYVFLLPALVLVGAAIVYPVEDHEGSP